MNLGAPGISKATADRSYQSLTIATVDVTTETTISTVKAQAASLTFTGALTADITYQLTTEIRSRRVENATTGAFTIYLKRGSSGVATPIPQGETVYIP